MPTNLCVLEPQNCLSAFWRWCVSVGFSLRTLTPSIQRDDAKWMEWKRGYPQVSEHGSLPDYNGLLPGEGMSSRSNENIRGFCQMSEAKLSGRWEGGVMLCKLRLDLQSNHHELGKWPKKWDRRSNWKRFLQGDVGCFYWRWGTGGAWLLPPASTAWSFYSMSNWEENPGRHRIHWGEFLNPIQPGNASGVPQEELCEYRSTGRGLE